MELKNKIAIVTGGSRGIGEQVCYAYAKEGATVIVVNKQNSKKTKEVVDAITRAGGNADAISCDVSDEASVNNLVATVIEKYGRIDILFHSAGIVLFKKLEDHTLEDWRHSINTNLTSAFLLSRATVPLMKTRQYGKLIFVSSVAGSYGFSDITAYSASKGGLIAFMKSLMVELAPFKINVNCLSPGNVMTDINEKFWRDPEVITAAKKRTPSGVAYMPPSDIAGAAVFLASDAANAVHGLDLIVDNALSVI